MARIRLEPRGPGRILAWIGMGLGLTTLVWWCVASLNRPVVPGPRQLLLAEVARSADQPVHDAWEHWGSRALPVLCEALVRQESAAGRWIRERRAWLAVRLGLRRLYRPSPDELRAAAARVVAALGTNATPAIPALIRALELSSQDPSNAAQICLVLRRFGPLASNAVPAVLFHLTNPPPNPAACQAVLVLNAPPGTWTILEREADPGIRLIAEIGTLLSRGRTNQACDRLAEALTEPQERRTAGILVEVFNSQTPRIASLLTGLLAHPDPPVRQAAADLLVGIDPGAAAAVHSIHYAGRAIETPVRNRYGPPALLPGGRSRPP